MVISSLHKIGISEEEVITNQSYWSCECKKDYIHPKTHTMCPYCGVWAKNQPDSDAKEVEEMLKVLEARLEYIRLGA